MKAAENPSNRDYTGLRFRFIGKGWEKIGGQWKLWMENVTKSKKYYLHALSFRRDRELWVEKLNTFSGLQFDNLLEQLNKLDPSDDKRIYMSGNKLQVGTRFVEDNLLFEVVEIVERGALCQYAKYPTGHKIIFEWGLIEIL